MTKLIKTVLISCFTWIILSSSSNPKTPASSLKDYYFPIEKLATPQVYHYKCSASVFGDLYWVLSSDKQNDSTFLNTEAYQLQTNGILVHSHNSKELITATGSEMLAFYFYNYVTYYDSSAFRLQGGDGLAMNKDLTICRKFKANIAERQIYAWDLEGNNELKFQRNYQHDSFNPAEPHLKNTTTKTRKFLENGNTSYMNKNYSTKIFSDNVELSSFNTATQKSIYTYSYKENSQYAKGIGLCKLERIANENPITYSITEILSLKEWEKIKSNAIKVNQDCEE